MIYRVQPYYGRSMGCETGFLNANFIRRFESFIRCLRMTEHWWNDVFQSQVNVFSR